MAVIDQSPYSDHLIVKQRLAQAFFVVAETALITIQLHIAALYPKEFYFITNCTNLSLKSVLKFVSKILILFLQVLS